jgi:hypothetical protein
MQYSKLWQDEVHQALNALGANGLKLPESSNNQSRPLGRGNQVGSNSNNRSQSFTGGGGNHRMIIH